MSKLAVTEMRVSEDDFETCIVEETESGTILRIIAIVQYPEYAESFLSNAALRSELEAVKASEQKMREALEPFVMAYTENGGCIPIDNDDVEEMLYSIFNVISLEDFLQAASALKGGKG